MNVYTSVAIINVALILLIGFGIYVTKSPWMLLGLFFLVSTESKKNEDNEKAK